MFPDLTLVDERPYGNRYDMVHCVSEPLYIRLSCHPTVSLLVSKNASCKRSPLNLLLIWKWLNNTIDDIDRNFFRNTEGCYVDENDVDSAAYRLEDQYLGDLHNYTKLIPNCGPKRPYEVWKIANTTDQSGKVDDSNNRCWSCPSLDCPSFAAAQWTDHTYCWLDGPAVEGNT
jgi:hypothetical protein